MYSFIPQIFQQLGIIPSIQFLALGIFSSLDILGSIGIFSFLNILRIRSFHLSLCKAVGIFSSLIILCYRYLYIHHFSLQGKTFPALTIYCSDFFYLSVTEAVEIFFILYYFRKQGSYHFNCKAVIIYSSLFTVDQLLFAKLFCD